MNEPGTAAAGGTPPSAEIPKNRPRVFAYRWFWPIAAVIFAADQVTKAAITSRIPFGTSSGDPGAVPLIPNFLYFIHVGNTGAAWSLFTGKSYLLAVLAAAALVAIYLVRTSLGLRGRGTQICFGLLCGGIVGNLCDRLAHGHVIDFIDVHFGRYIYPTFNVADSAICVGVIFYLAGSLRRGGR